MLQLKKAYAIALCCVGLGYSAHAQTEVTFYTTKGSFKIELTDALAPITVDSFLARVSDKFYDGLIFHRVIDNFMIQGGDPAGNGTGGPGYTIPDEFHPTLKNVPKALAMANAGANTGGSQFFINLVTNSHLNNKHTVFGMVTTNFNVVQEIGSTPTDGNDRPLTNMVIDSIRVTKFPASVRNSINDVKVMAYPNPCKGSFTLELPAIASTIEVLNSAGQVVYTKNAKDILQVNLNQPAGLYHVRMSNKEGTTELKIIVQ